MQWAGDDWASLATDERSEKALKMEEKSLLRGGGGGGNNYKQPWFC